MKLFTKEVDKQLFAQYSKGSDLENQMVVAKIFNPYGRGVWYLLNSDPNDPDYIWAIVDLFEPDMGSVSRSELQTVKVPPFGLGLERDIYFTPKPAKEVWEGVMKGERFAHGGMTAGRYYKDNSGNELRYIGESEGKLLFKDGEKIVKKSEEDFEDSPKEYKLFGIFAEGGETEDEGVDLFEDYDDIPANVQKILQKYDFEEGDYRILEKAKKDVEKVGYTFEYSLDGTAYDLRKIGQKGKSEDEYADGGRVKGKNNQTGETYGVVIGSVKKSDENIEGGTEMNVRSGYSSRISEVKLVFDKNGNLYEITDYGYGLEGNYPDTSRRSGGRIYNADKKETLQVLSKKYNPAFAKKLIELAKDSKMADGGETAAAEHNIKQAKYGARLVGKQKNLDVNKNGKLDAEDFKILRGKKMAMGGKVKFEDKVKEVQKSLLKRKKVAPVVQKDYGKTYNRKEALDSAKRIIGAQTAKWEKRNKK